MSVVESDFDVENLDDLNELLELSDEEGSDTQPNDSLATVKNNLVVKSKNTSDIKKNSRANNWVFSDISGGNQKTKKILSFCGVYSNTEF